MVEVRVRLATAFLNTQGGPLNVTDISNQCRCYYRPKNIISKCANEDLFFRNSITMNFVSNETINENQLLFIGVASLHLLLMVIKNFSQLMIIPFIDVNCDYFIYIIVKSDHFSNFFVYECINPFYFFFYEKSFIPNIENNLIFFSSTKIYHFIKNFTYAH